MIPAAIGAGAAMVLAPLVGSHPPKDDSGPPSFATARAKEGHSELTRSRVPMPRRAGAWSRGTADGAALTDEASSDADADDAGEGANLGFESPEAEYASLLAGRSDHEARWRAEAVDVGWARGAQVSLQRDLERIAEGASGNDGGGFEVHEVACRSTMCLARIHWASATEAVEHAGRLAIASYDEKCGIFLLGPSPDALAGATEFTQEVYFDCRDEHS